MTTASRGRFEARVTGRVQGVGFRWFVLDRATALGLDGWVANAADGTVVLVAEGERSALVTLETTLRSGPSGARVDDLRTVWTAPTGRSDGFHIRSLGHAGD